MLTKFAQVGCREQHGRARTGRSPVLVATPPPPSSRTEKLFKAGATQTTHIPIRDEKCFKQKCLQSNPEASGACLWRRKRNEWGGGAIRRMLCKIQRNVFVFLNLRDMINYLHNREKLFKCWSHKGAVCLARMQPCK